MEKVANNLCSQHDATSKAVSESPPNHPTVRKSEGSHGCSPSTFSEKYLPRRKVNVRLKDAKANSLETAKKDAIVGHHKITSPGLKLFPREQHPPTNEKLKLGQKRKVETPRNTNSPKEDGTSEVRCLQIYLALYFDFVNCYFRFLSRSVLIQILPSFSYEISSSHCIKVIGSRVISESTISKTISLACKVLQMCLSLQNIPEQLGSIKSHCKA